MPVITLCDAYKKSEICKTSKKNLQNRLKYGKLIELEKQLNEFENNKTTDWTPMYAIPIGRAKAEINTLKIIDFETDSALKHTDDSELVHRNGNETISGTKTFEPTQADGRLVFKLNDITIGQTPSVNHFGGYKCVDSQGVEFGNCNSSYNTAGRIGTNFYVQRKMTDGQTKSASLGVFIDADGTTYAQAPTT